jgi:hypothetical protein
MLLENMQLCNQILEGPIQHPQLALDKHLEDLRRSVATQERLLTSEHVLLISGESSQDCKTAEDTAKPFQSYEQICGGPAVKFKRAPDMRGKHGATDYRDCVLVIK